jgi:putative membrane protein
VLPHVHFLATLHEMDIPVGYNTRAAMAINAAVGFMGVMLGGYLFLGVL